MTVPPINPTPQPPSKPLKKGGAGAAVGGLIIAVVLTFVLGSIAISTVTFLGKDSSTSTTMTSPPPAPTTAPESTPPAEPTGHGATCEGLYEEHYDETEYTHSQYIDVCLALLDCTSEWDTGLHSDLTDRETWISECIAERSGDY
jgi:hypothetical protein